jgi:hypothetical protein
LCFFVLFSRFSRFSLFSSLSLPSPLANLQPCSGAVQLSLPLLLSVLAYPPFCRNCDKWNMNSCHLLQMQHPPVANGTRIFVPFAIGGCCICDRWNKNSPWVVALRAADATDSPSPSTWLAVAGVLKLRRRRHLPSKAAHMSEVTQATTGILKALHAL